VVSTNSFINPNIADTNIVNNSIITSNKIDNNLINNMSLELQPPAFMNNQVPGSPDSKSPRYSNNQLPMRPRSVSSSVIKKNTSRLLKERKEVENKLILKTLPLLISGNDNCDNTSVLTFDDKSFGSR
jgi:hypothetical protein